MDTHVFTICTGVLLFCSSLISNVLAYAITEVWPPVFPFKPFNCWGCLSFWFTLVFGLAVMLELAPSYLHPETRTVFRYGCAGVSVLLGLVNYFYIKAKYQVYE